MQLRALKRAGCRKVFRDVRSGATTHRAGLDKALRYLQANDVLVVWKLDRLGRSLPHLLSVLQDLDRRNVGFLSLTENIDTTTAIGRLIFSFIGALAEFERSLIAERTREGQAAARARGAHIGRRKLLTRAKLIEARRRVARGERAISVAHRLRVGVSTLYRELKGG